MFKLKFRDGRHIFYLHHVFILFALAVMKRQCTRLARVCGNLLGIYYFYMVR